MGKYKVCTLSWEHDATHEAMSLPIWAPEGMSPTEADGVMMNPIDAENWKVSRVPVDDVFLPVLRDSWCPRGDAWLRPKGAESHTVLRASGNAEAAKAMGFIAGQIESSLTKREGVLAGRPLGGSDYVFGPGDYPSGGRKTTEPEGWRCECVIEGGGRADGTITKLCPAHLRSYSRWAANEKAAYVEKIKAEARAEAVAELGDAKGSWSGQIAGLKTQIGILGAAANIERQRANALADTLQTRTDENTALLAENARLRRKMEGRR